MITILAGSRPPKNIRYDPAQLFQWYKRMAPILDTAIERSGFTIDKVVSGKAPGFDTLGEDWADKRGIEIIPMPADWSTGKKAAGIIRNIRMGNLAEALVAVDIGGTPGTNHMCTYMEFLKKPFYRHYIPY